MDRRVRSHRCGIRTKDLHLKSIIAKFPQSNSDKLPGMRKPQELCQIIISIVELDGAEEASMMHPLATAMVLSPILKSY